MEYFSDRKNNTVSKLDKDVMSNLFFQLGPKHSRLHQFEKYGKFFQEEKTSKIYNSINFQSRNITRNRITSDTLYIFNESNKKPRREIQLNPKYFLNSEDDYKEFFPTQINDSSVRIPIIKKLKENKKDNENEDDDDDEYKPPEIHHKQIVFLKGKNNKTYLYKNLKNSYPYNTNLNELDLTPYVPCMFGNKFEKKLDDFAMMEKIDKNRKPAFKLK